MKPLLFLALIVLSLLAVVPKGARDISEADMIHALSVSPKLYTYSDFSFSNKSQTKDETQSQMTFNYRYTRTAKTHIAMINGAYVSVDNNFINNCLDYPEQYECQFVTEMGTVEEVDGSDCVIFVNKWGIFSSDNVQKAVLSDKTFNFLSAFLDLFKSSDS